MATPWPDYGAINGPIVMIGFGSIGRGTLPLIERHFDFDSSRFVEISRYVGQASCRPVPEWKAIVGEKVFSHESGLVPISSITLWTAMMSPVLLRA